MALPASFTRQPLLNPLPIEFPLPPFATTGNETAFGNLPVPHHLSDPCRSTTELVCQIGRTNYVSRLWIKVICDAFQICLDFRKDSKRIWPYLHNYCYRTRRTAARMLGKQDGLFDIFHSSLNYCLHGSPIIYPVLVKCSSLSFSIHRPLAIYEIIR